MLDDPKSHPMVAFFFDNLLPIPDLSGLTREATPFPNWSSSIGAAMRTEVQRFLEYEIYENTTQVAAPVRAGELAGDLDRALHVREPVAVHVLRGLDVRAWTPASRARRSRR